MCMFTRSLCGELDLALKNSLKISGAYRCTTWTDVATCCITCSLPNTALEGDVTKAGDSIISHY